MSAPKARDPKRRTLAQRQAEIKGDPYPLWVDDETCVEVPRPTTEQLFAAESATSSKNGIIALCGGKSDEVIEALSGVDASITIEILDEMREHFGLGN